MQNATRVEPNKPALLSNVEIVVPVPRQSEEVEPVRRLKVLGAWRLVWKGTGVTWGAASCAGSKSIDQYLCLVERQCASGIPYQRFLSHNGSLCPS